MKYLQSKRDTKMLLGTSPEDLTYSIYIERINKNQNFECKTCTKERNSLIWVPDSDVDCCYDCKYKFGFLGGKHHCRACGRIFCHSCSKNSIVLPKNIEKFPEPPPPGYFQYFQRKPKTNEVRVCNNCYNKFKSIKNIEIYILIFSYLDLVMWAKLMRVCKLFREAVYFCKNIFRNIQFVLPGYELSAIQKRMLFQNVKYLYGHSRYIIKYLTLIDWYDEEQTSMAYELLTNKRKYSCLTLACTRQCNENIKHYELLEIINSQYYICCYVKDIIIEKFSRLSDEELIVYLFQLIYCEKYGLSLKDFLISKSVNENIRMAIYWILTMFKNIDNDFRTIYNYYMNDINLKFGKNVIYNELIAGRKLFKLIADLPTDVEKYIKEKTYNFMDKNQKFTMFKDINCCVRLNKVDPIYVPEERSIPYPLNCKYGIHSLELFNIERKKSSTAPFIVAFICGKQTCKCMVKKESLFKDYLIINIIKLMDYILKQDLNIDFGIKTYQVLCLKKNVGIIEIIQDAETIYNIKYGLKTSILNFILNNNSHLSVNDIRERFIKSTSAYCVISYLLGIGDRHLDNIMVTKDGYLFHIDYGFILGIEPKPLAQYIRISEDIVEAIGGKESNYYKYFLDLCVKIYNCLRKYVWLFMGMLNIIPEYEKKYKDSYIHEEVVKRFLPSENDEEAEKRLTIKIEQSCDNYTTSIIDFFHYHSREFLN